MPIHCPITIEPITETVFDDIDAVVMKHSYASQNALGRLCDERIYENDLAHQLKEAGLPDVHTQVPVLLTHRSFSKTYRLDLVVNQMVYELKTVQKLAPEHQAQAIHYAVMLAVDRVKLINFRSPRVLGKLVRAPFLPSNRDQFTLSKKRWRPLSENCPRLLDDMLGLLSDVGTCLESQLYAEALIHFCGGEDRCLRRVPVQRNGRPMGSHRINCHAEDVAFTVSAFSDPAEHESHLRRLVSLLPLRGIQWFNLNHTELQVTTLEPSKST